MYNGRHHLGNHYRDLYGGRSPARLARLLLALAAAIAVLLALPQAPMVQAGAGDVTGKPTITGTAQVGQTLTANTSGIADADGLDNPTFNYHWMRGDGNTYTNIAGETAQTYELSGDDEGRTIKVRVSFQDDADNEESLTSAATSEVEPRPNSEAMGAPTISGTVRVGETLTADVAGIYDADGLSNVSYSYQWMADDSDIAGATGPTYTPSDDDEDKIIRVKVSFIDDAGNEETLTSEAMIKVAARPNRPATGRVTISGTIQVGETLTADTSGISDADGLKNAVFNYQWILNVSKYGKLDLTISGATGSTYTLKDDDLGNMIRVRVTFTDDRDNEESLTSLRSFKYLVRSVCPEGGHRVAPMAVEHAGAVPVMVESTTEEYFVLYVRPDLDSHWEIPVSVTLGRDGTTTLTEQPSALPKEHYRVERYLTSDPSDVDGDCVDDITELHDSVGMNPLNPALTIPLSFGALTIPDRETFETLSYQGDRVLIDSHLIDLEYVKFFLLGMDTDRPAVYFQNTEKFRAHGSFAGVVDLWDNPLWGPTGVMKGEIVYHPDVVAPDGTRGVYRYAFEPSDTYSFEEVRHSYEVLAASMTLLDNNLVYYPMPGALPLYHLEKEFYDASRVNVILDEDIFPEADYIPLNVGQGYGFLRHLAPDQRPNARDIVVYDILPNDLSRVAGIITTVPQTPLSHVNLRAVQDNIPNAFIREALEQDGIEDLLDKYVRFETTETGYSIRKASPAEVAAHHAASRPYKTQVPQRDLSATTLTDLDDITFQDWDAFGVKAANLAVLRTLGFPAGTVPDGFAAPFHFYDEFMKHNGLYDEVRKMLDGPEFQSDYGVQKSELKKLRRKIKDARSPGWIITALEEMHATYPEGQSLRYRSSTNNEDLPGFSGAGLYDSKTQHPAETEEDGIDKSLKQVYASLWNFRAFTEREFHRIDHLHAAMGVLVHPNFENELANGAAVTFDPTINQGTSYYVNTQLGEDLVTNPEAGSLPEKILLHTDGSHTVLARSNQTEGEKLLLTTEQLDQLRSHMRTIHDRFAVLYGTEAVEQFAMEIEFKITSEDILAIKQARPWVFSQEPTCNSLWCANAVVVARENVPTFVGYLDHPFFTGSSITDDSFEHEGITYSVKGVSNYKAGAKAAIRLEPLPTAEQADGLTLHIENIAMPFADGTRSKSDWEWGHPRLGEDNTPFTDGATVSLRITEDESAPEEIQGNTPNPPRPNIVLILADDFGWGDVSTNSPDSQMSTQNIDSIAVGGINFSDAHSPSAVCSPTRYGILTGRYAWRSWLPRGVLHFNSRPMIAPGQETLATLLQRRGYRTAAVGKWHLGMDFTHLSSIAEVNAFNLGVDYSGEIVDGPLDHGFDEFFGTTTNLFVDKEVYIRDRNFTGNPDANLPGAPGLYGADESLGLLTQEATRFIERQAQADTPFFLYLPFHAVHNPLVPSTEFDGLTGIGDYADVVAEMDHSVGLLLKALKDNGVHEDTLVIFTSDNGSEYQRNHIPNQRPHMHNGPWRSYKGRIYEGGQRVPFMMQWPEVIAAGTTIDATVSLTDVYATLAELLEANPGASQGPDSVSLLPLIRGERADRGEPVVHHSGRGMFAVRDGQWKLIFGNGSGAGKGANAGTPFGIPWQLYDLENDPGETTNLIDDHPGVVARLTATLERIRKAEDGRLSGDATLRSLRIPGLYLGAFDARTTSYEAAVDQGISTVEIVADPTVTDAPVEIRVPGTTVDSKNILVGGRGTVTLLKGITTIELVVASPDKAARTTYTVTVSRNRQDQRPAVNGAFQTGQTLTVDTSAIKHRTGEDPPTYGYQWLWAGKAADEEIPGATGQTYSLGSRDTGKHLKVRLTLAYLNGSIEILVSRAEGPVEDGQPVWNADIAATRWENGTLGAPTSDLITNQGGTAGLTASQFWYWEPGRWLRLMFDRNIADTDRLTLHAGGMELPLDQGGGSRDFTWHNVDVDWTAGETASAEILRTPVTTGAPENSPATGAPTIGGTLRVGETLTASTSGIADADGMDNAGFSYQWMRGDGDAHTDIAGETGRTYGLSGDDVGKTIQVRVSFRDDADNEESVTSAATSEVEPKPNSEATGAPTIGGTPRAGETLTASTTGIADADGLTNVSYSHQWMRDDTDIAGATSSTYEIGDADVGKTIRVRVTFRDDANNQEELTSAATGAVAPRPPLTARFESKPSSHDGQADFIFELHFSEEFGISYLTLRDHAFTVTGGTVTKAQRLTQGSNVGWRITVTPGSDAEVTVLLPATTDCDATGAICTGDGRMLSNRNEFTVSGPTQ